VLLPERLVENGRHHETVRVCPQQFWNRAAKFRAKSVQKPDHWKKTCGLVAPPSECALILYRCRRFINHLLTYLLTYLANANEVSGSKSGVPDTTCCYVTVTYKSSVDFVDEAFRSQLQQVLCILWTCCPYQTAVTVWQLQTKSQNSIKSSTAGAHNIAMTPLLCWGWRSNAIGRSVILIAVKDVSK